MNIYIICSVRNAPETYRKRLEDYAALMERGGSKVHLPHRDTNQKAGPMEICRENREAIIKADEVHVFYSPASQGTHFDMGIAFALRKPVHIIEEIGRAHV